MQDRTGGPGTFYRSDFCQGRSPSWLPEFIAAPYAYALPWVELLFGALLMLGLFNRLSAGMASLIFLSIALAWLSAGSLLARHMLMIHLLLGLFFFFETDDSTPIAAI